MMEVGRICKKIAGKESGRYCVVTKEESKFVQIYGIEKYKMCKPRRCNKKHLIATKIKIDLNGNSPTEIEKSIKESGILTKLGLKKIKLNKKSRKKLENARKRSAMNKPKKKKNTEKE
ncbi:MAG: hypothetical protein B6U88_02895 [Candidatus Aenigmarchaeota archaeon ex4484_56]|nr:MAG: hypothetical protein B6U88_02895 [Candidatus Aenigmarchaeota archaeon ex4484_56]